MLTRAHSPAMSEHSLLPPAASAGSPPDDVSLQGPPRRYTPHPIGTPGGVERRAVGRTRYVHGEHRTAGWLDGPIADALCCPLGHHIKDGALVIGEQPMRCHERVAAGRECSLLVWLIVDHRSGATFVAEVDWQDVRTIQSHRSTSETLRYLGAMMWPARQPRRHD